MSNNKWILSSVLEEFNKKQKELMNKKASIMSLDQFAHNMETIEKEFPTPINFNKLIFDKICEMEECNKQMHNNLYNMLSTILGHMFNNGWFSVSNKKA